MTANPEPEAIPLRSRSLLHLHAAGTTICVDHVYEAEGAGTCEHDGCDGLSHDPGMVGLMLHDEDGTTSALLDAGDALLLAERLQRAASLVLESEEDAPDIEREAARYTATEPTP